MLKSFVSSLIVERFLKENSWDNSLHCFHDGEKIKSHLLLPTVEILFKWEHGEVLSL